MNSCYHCGKTILFGRSHTHHRGVAGGRWKKRAPKTQRIFKVNFQRVDIVEEGETKRVKLCAKCLKRIRFDTEHGRKPFLTLAHTLSQKATPTPLKKATKESEVVVASA